MRLPHMFGVLTASALLIGASSANALELTIDDLATAAVDVTLTDNLVPGLVNYNSAVDGNVGMFSVVVSTGLGDPFVGGPGEAEIDLSVQAGSPVEGTLVVTLTDEDMTIPAVDSGATSVHSSFSINANSNAGATVESFIRIGAATTFEALSTLAGTGEVNLVETLRRIIASGETFDIRTVVTIDFDKFGFASADANLNVAPIPLPAALPLFLTALLGLGFVGRHRRRMAA